MDLNEDVAYFEFVLVCKLFVVDFVNNIKLDKVVS